MRSLFEKEEKENAFNQLKVDLISRFYLFQKDEILKYKSVLNFDRYHLMINDSVQWNNDLLDNLGGKIDWTALYKIKNLKLDLEFFKKYEPKIEFSSIHLSNNIDWSDNLLLEYGDRFDWGKRLITKKPLSTIENLRRFKDKINWSSASQGINLEFTEDILKEFSDNWDWKKLSANKNLPISVEFIQRHIEQLDFDELSQNPKSLDLIYKYPTSNKWNWGKVILNPAITYDKQSYDLFFSNFKKRHEVNKYSDPNFGKRILYSFISHIFLKQQNNVDYFLTDEFIDFVPWQRLCKFCNTKLSLDFIEKYKDKLDFKESEFIRNHQEIIPTDFISKNLNLFNPDHYSFYYLQLTPDLINKFEGKLNWNYLSSCEKFNWDWEFVDENFDKLNFYRLSENIGFYERLIKNKLGNIGILEFLDEELKKKRK